MQKKSDEEGKKTAEEKPVHKKLSQAEYEEKVIELAKSGLTSEKIGEKLKREGIHSGDHEKKISKILKDKDLYVNSDLKNVQAKLENLDKHFQSNKQDKRALKDKERIHGKFRKLKKYFDGN